MSIIDLLRHNTKLVLFNRFRIHRNNPDFAQFVIEGYNNPDYIHLEHCGDEYPGKTIYLADEQGNNMGFFAELGVTLIKLYYADHRGFTPYVSWGERFLYYSDIEHASEKHNGRHNVFLDFFRPVSEVMSYDKACHLVRSQYTHYEWVKKKFNAISYDVSEEYVDAMSAMMKKYIHYNDETEAYLREQFVSLLGTTDLSYAESMDEIAARTIAVHYRGTDFKRAYNNHPVAVSIEQAIHEAGTLLQSNKGYNQIFLATDDEEAVERFREAFGDKVKIYEDVFRETSGDESIAFSHSDRTDHKHKLCLEVLRDQYTLTNCDALVCGYSNVTFLARIMRKAWHDEYFRDYRLINNGINHNNNSFSNSRH